ncbi:hypothetical protein [Desulfonatronum parangueonense]
MDIRSDRKLSKSMGWFALFLSLILFLVWGWLWPAGMYSAVLGCFLLLFGGACITYRHEVHIDAESDVVEQYRRILFWERHRGFLFSSFREIGVAAVLGGDLRPVHLAHVIELRGSSRLVLPGLYPGLAKAKATATELGTTLGLPAAQRTRTILIR